MFFLKWFSVPWRVGVEKKRNSHFNQFGNGLVADLITGFVIDSFLDKDLMEEMQY